MTLAKQVTDPAKGVWAFDDIFAMVQMFHGCPERATAGVVSAPTAASSSSTRPPSSRRRCEFTAKLFKDGLVHPDS